MLLHRTSQSNFERWFKKRIFASGVVRRPDTVRDSIHHRVGQLDDFPELVEALAEASYGAVQVPQRVVKLGIK